MTPESSSISERPRNFHEGRFEEFCLLAQDRARKIMTNGRDPYTRAFDESFAQRLVEDNEFGEYFRSNVINLYNHLHPDELIRRNIKTFQFLESSRKGANFPYDRSTPAQWNEAFDTLTSDTEEGEKYQKAYTLNMAFEITSNVDERGALVKLATALYEIEDPTYVDGGCSLGLLLRRLRLSGDVDLAYNDITVVRGNLRDGVTPDHDSSALLNQAMKIAPAGFGPSIEVDAVDFQGDETRRARAVSDSQYMGELVIDAMQEKRGMLSQYDDPPLQQLKRIKSDVAELRPEMFDTKFKVGILSTMLYESKADPEKVEQMIHSMLSLLDPDGILVILDFIKPKRNLKPSNLEFYKHWPAYSYGLFVVENWDETREVKHLARVHSGRVESILPQEYMWDIPGAYKMGLARRSHRVDYTYPS